MDVSKHSTASYRQDQSEEAKENIRRFWAEVEEAKLKKFKEELEAKGL